jgi:hypothetical protein
VIDAVGIQEIFEACPQFLAKGKLYVTVGPRQPSYTVLGILSTLGLMVKNILWPQLLGGVPRPYVQVAAVASLPAMQELVRMVEAGRLSVRVGAAVNMAGALEVSCQIVQIHKLTRCRRTTDCLVATPKERLLWRWRDSEILQCKGDCIAKRHIP